MSLYISVSVFEQVLQPSTGPDSHRAERKALPSPHPQPLPQGRGELTALRDESCDLFSGEEEVTLTVTGGG